MHTEFQVGDGLTFGPENIFVMGGNAMQEVVALINLLVNIVISLQTGKPSI
ncbi:MAG: hypothetical protein U5L96_19295 [Owenweeksia sp.]|nr:hypothetical protein [Owenweeksia sp.]